MSLLSETYESCTMYDKTRVPDGFGGTKEVYKEGVKFKAAIVLDSSMEARVANQQGVKNVYTITTPKNVNLQFHDVLKRDKDSKFFRVSSDGDDKATPESSRLNMRQVSAEEWSLPA